MSLLIVEFGIWVLQVLVLRVLFSLSLSLFHVLFLYQRWSFPVVLYGVKYLNIESRKSSTVFFGEKEKII